MIKPYVSMMCGFKSKRNCNWSLEALGKSIFWGSWRTWLQRSDRLNVGCSDGTWGRRTHSNPLPTWSQLESKVRLFSLNNTTSTFSWKYSTSVHTLFCCVAGTTFASIRITNIILKLYIFKRILRYLTCESDCFTFYL